MLTNGNVLLHDVNAVSRARHSKKEVEQALKEAEQEGWLVESKSSGHRWGVAKCGRGCRISIWSTPKNPGNHGKDLRRAVGRCPHGEEAEGDA